MTTQIFKLTFCLLFAVVFTAVSALEAVGQVRRFELTDFSNADKHRRSAVLNVVQRGNTHMIVEFNSSLRRYSLESGKEEAIVFDLTRIPLLQDQDGPASKIAAAGDGSWFLLSHLANDSLKGPEVGTEHYLFDSSVWTCEQQVEPVARWHSQNPTMCNQILEKPGLVINARFLGRRNELVVRRLDAKAEVIQRIMIPGNFCGAWWDEERGLAVLCGKNEPINSDANLLDIDIQKGRITRQRTWRSQFSLVQLLPKTASALVRSNQQSGETYVLEFDKPPQPLISRSNPAYASNVVASPNGRYFVGHTPSELRQQYLLDLQASREIAVFDAPGEVAFMLTDDGRFCVSAIHSHDNGRQIRKLVVREFR
ncbi:MAG: hypothetical protein AB8B50_11645 [Pirellulaceae bacterium]